jgi:GNAT superfamily N-acetyltransferase
LGVDVELVRAWLTARSVARGLPQPIPDFGGFRVDTHSEKEVRRWVFASAIDGIDELARSIREPRHLLKLCGTSDELARCLPSRWAASDTGSFLESGSDISSDEPLPQGYRLELIRNGAATKAEIRTDKGALAASGYAAETPDAFVYDRIETDAAHRRRGLGRAIMVGLGSCRKSRSARQLLVATPEGEKLYLKLGWRKLSPYATAKVSED